MYAMWKDYDNVSVNTPNFKCKVDLKPIIMSEQGLCTLFEIEVFNALPTRFGPSKYTSLKTTLQNTNPN